MRRENKAARLYSPELDSAGIKQLANAVILQAVKDYVRKGIKSTSHESAGALAQDSAKKFLNNSDELKLWSALADKDPGQIASILRKKKSTILKSLYQNRITSTAEE